MHIFGTFQKMLIFALQSHPGGCEACKSEYMEFYPHCEQENESAELLKGCPRHTFRGEENEKDTIRYHGAVLMLDLYFMQQFFQRIRTGKR